MKHFTLLISLSLAFHVVSAQLVEVLPSSKSTFRSDFLKRQQGQFDKRTSCGTDTLTYAQYNSQNDRFLLLDPSATNAQEGVGLYFKVDDTVWVHGFNFYAYSYAANTQVNCRIYYANTSNKEPAGVPIATKTHTVGTGFNYVPWMLQRVTFNQPVKMVKDFVLTVENTTSYNMVFAANDWTSKDGRGNRYSSIKFENGWVASSITVGTDPFDADFYFEPYVSYNLSTQFEPSEESCLGNGEVFKFNNTTTHMLNPQFSPGANDTTLDDDFFWDYGDGSIIDTAVHGENMYLGSSTYFVNLEGKFKTWTGSCTDDTTILLEESDLLANFNSKRTDLLVEFQDKSVGAETWDWDFGDGSNGSQTRNPTHVYANYGQYNVSLTVTNKGCTATTTLVVIIENEYIGLKEEVQEEWRVELSPNPARNVLNIFSNYENSTYELFNIQGESIRSGGILGAEKLDVSDLNSGMYFMRFSNQESTLTKRLIIE